MQLLFEELDYQETPLGGICLRRRADPRLEGLVIYEVSLGEEFLMSSLFTEAEIELSTLALAAIDFEKMDVVVGGLGLGYTAAAALQEERVASLRVIEVMPAVIDWHQRHLVPLGEQLSGDARCELHCADFFAMAESSEAGFHEDEPGRLVHAVLLDIDHSPTHWLNPDNSRFYTEEGLKLLAAKIHPRGIFGLWSNDPPDENFIARLEAVFPRVEHHVVSFDNPYTGGQASNTVYLAHRSE